MKKFILASALFVALVLVIAPVLAASPTTTHKVIWRGSGVAENGEHVKFSGAVVLNDGLFWNGDGTFTDQDGMLKANMIMQFPGAEPLGGKLSLYGIADVTVRGFRYRNCEINLNIDKAKPEYDLVIIAPGGMSILGRYIVTGNNFRGSIRMR